MQLFRGSFRSQPFFPKISLVNAREVVKKNRRLGLWPETICSRAKPKSAGKLSDYHSALDKIFQKGKIFGTCSIGIKLDLDKREK
jgi:hypothetical protein